MWSKIVQYGVPALKFSGKVVGGTILGILTHKTVNYAVDKGDEWNRERKAKNEAAEQQKKAA